MGGKGIREYKIYYHTTQKRNNKKLQHLKTHIHNWKNEECGSMHCKTNIKTIHD